MSSEPDRRHPTPSRTGVLVVLVCLGLCFALCIPAVQTMRARAAREQSRNNLLQIVLACHNASGANGRLPPAFGSYPLEEPSQAHKGPTGSLFYLILPYLEATNLPYTSDTESFRLPVNTYVCKTFVAALDPTNPGTSNRVSYSSNYAVFGTGGARLPGTFKRGTAHTIVFAEKYAVAGRVPDGFESPVPDSPPVDYTWSDSVYALPAPDRNGPFYPYPASISPVCFNPVFSSLDFTLATSSPQAKTPTQFNPAEANVMACSVQGFEPDVCQVAMGDASVRRVSPTMRPATFTWAGNPVGEPGPPSDW